MNARVFLLVLVTGSFMAIWNSDEKAMQAALARRQQAMNHQIAQTDVACESDINVSHRGIHDVTAETEVFVGDVAETTLVAEMELTGSQIEVTAEELLEAAEVEVIELESDVEMSSDLPVVEEFIVESWIQTIAPEDFCVNSQPIAQQTSPAFAFADSHDKRRDFELNHATTHLVNPILASIEDAVAHHDDESSEESSEPVNAVLTEEPISASATPDQDVQHGHETIEDAPSTTEDSPLATEADGAENDQSALGQNLEQAPVAVETKQHEDVVPVAQDSEPSAVVEQKKEDPSTSEVKPIIPMEGPSIPLPANLANGTWQVVDADGKSFKITIDRSSPRGSSKKVTEEAEAFEENFCIRTTALGERWCFVRSYETASPSKRVATEFFSPKQTSPDRE
jgi:hypothetical protein